MSENPLTIFQGELEQREQEIVNTLPSTIKPEQFKNAAITAIKQNPELLKVDRRSLHKAITHAARDGMLPDGREGVILIQREKVKRNGKEEWTQGARWQAMTYGVRKRLRETDGILVDAQTVHENDDFVWHQGDDARIEHRPVLGKPRGKMIGAYAIFRRGSEVVHREVMGADEIEVVRTTSKRPDADLWTKFASEAWKKTVVRRGIKTVIVSDQLRQIFDRDDEQHFDFHQRLAPPPIPPAIPAPPTHEIEEVERANGRPFEESIEQESPGEYPPPLEAAEIPELSTIKALFGSARSKAAIAKIESRMSPGIMLMDEETRAAAVEVIQAAKARVQ